MIDTYTFEMITESAAVIYLNGKKQDGLTSLAGIMVWQYTGYISSVGCVGL
jgi:hypothetical protein